MQRELLLVLSLFLLQASWAANVPFVTVPPLIVEGPDVNQDGEILFEVEHDPEVKSSELVLTCRASGTPHPQYHWLKDNEDFVPDNVRVYSAEDDGTIVFSETQTEDEGTYQCIASNNVGSARSVKANLRRTWMGAFPPTEPTYISAMAGQPLQLRCDAPDGYPDPKLHWILQTNDGALQSLDSARVTVDSEGSLWFAYVTPEDASDEALYACSASSASNRRELFLVETDSGELRLLDDPPASGLIAALNLPTEYKIGNWVYLNVTEPPNWQTEKLSSPSLVSTSEQKVSVQGGQDVKLFCVFTGMPIPDVKWEREDDDDDDDDDDDETSEEFSFSYYGRVLIIDDVEEKDAGRYSCQGVSEEGETDKFFFNLDVHYAPEITEGPSNVNVPEGDSASFTCIVKGDPDPQIRWTINGEDADVDGENVLIIDDVAFEDKSTIGCEATNKYGTDYDEAYLNILSLPPEWKGEPEDVIVLEGEDALLQCDVHGSPKPSVRWYIEAHGEKELIQFQNDSETDDGNEKDVPLADDQRLMIFSSDPGDDGIYVCVAENLFGSIEAKIRLRVRGPTRAHIEVEDNEVAAGKDAHFTCHVIADEELDVHVTWFFKEHPIDDEGAHYSIDNIDSDPDEYSSIFKLTVHDVSMNDSGTYVCRAETGEDHTEVEANVMVQDVPSPPKILDVTCERREVTLHWQAGSENHMPILAYRILYSTDDDEWHEPHMQIPAYYTEYTLDLKPGQEYKFRVLAVNRIGESAPSEDGLECITPPAAPDVNPSNVTVQGKEPNNLEVSWQPVGEEDHNGPEFHYVVSWRRLKDDKEDVLPGDDLQENDEVQSEIVHGWHEESFEVDVGDFGRFAARVVSANSVGEGPPAPWVEGFSGEDVPTAAPTNLQVAVMSPDTVVFSWTPVDCDELNGLLSGYQIHIWTDEEETGDDNDLHFITSVDEAEIGDLDPFTSYSATISAMNGKFEGPSSEIVKFSTPEGVPGQVEELTVAALGSESLFVSWKEPDDINGVLLGYSLSYQTYDDDTDDLGVLHEIDDDINEDDLVYKLTNLEEDTQYRVTVVAYTSAGDGDDSSVDVSTSDGVAMVPAKPSFSWVLLEEEDDDYDDVTMIEDDVIDVDNKHDDDDSSGINDITKGEQDENGKDDDDDDDDDDDVTTNEINDCDDDDCDSDVDSDDDDDDDDDDDIVDSDYSVDIDNGDDGDLSNEENKTGDSESPVNIEITWHPNIDSHPGVDFYTQYRVYDGEEWQTTPVEDHKLQMVLKSLDPSQLYELRVVAKDGEYETPSSTVLILPGSPEEVPSPPESPTVAMVLDDPGIWGTWLVVAIITASLMLLVIIFSLWVHNYRLRRVAELRAQLYDGMSPAGGNAEVPLAGEDGDEEELTANYQRKQMAAMMRRQNTVQSEADSFASHDDDFAEYGDEAMAVDLLNSVTLVTNPRLLKDSK